MKIINRQRATGKTTMLIHASAVTGMQIVAMTKQRAAYIKKQAYELGCVIPEPIEYERLTARRYERNPVDYGVLIDEAEGLIEKALERYLGSKVAAITMSCPMYESEPPAKLKDKEPRQDMTVRELLLRMAIKAKAFSTTAKIEIDPFFVPANMDDHLAYLEAAFPAEVPNAEV
jgi:hypothetical protein